MRCFCVYWYKNILKNPKWLYLLFSTTLRRMKSRSLNQKKLLSSLEFVDSLWEEKFSVAITHSLQSLGLSEPQPSVCLSLSRSKQLLSSLEIFVFLRITVLNFFFKLCGWPALFVWGGYGSSVLGPAGQAGKIYIKNDSNPRRGGAGGADPTRNPGLFPTLFSS